MADQPTPPPNGTALDADLRDEFVKLLKSKTFACDVVEWIDCPDMERHDRTLMLADKLRRVARAVFEKPH